MARPRKKKATPLTLNKHELVQIVVSACILLVLITMLAVLVPERIKIDIERLPGAAVDALYSAQVAIGNTYIAAVEDYNTTVYQGLDAAVAVYGEGLQRYIDGVYVAGDLSAAVYAGIAALYVNAITSVHDSQVASIEYMGESMANGASDVAAATAALDGWYNDSTARINGRLQSY